MTCRGGCITSGRVISVDLVIGVRLFDEDTVTDVVEADVVDGVAIGG